MNNSYLTPSQLKAKRKNFSILATLIVLIVITFVISMNTGVIKLTPMEVLRTLLVKVTHNNSLSYMNSDFQNSDCCISRYGVSYFRRYFTGHFQKCFSRPGILGINAGAGLAVMLYVSFSQLRKQHLFIYCRYWLLWGQV